MKKDGSLETQIEAPHALGYSTSDLKLFYGGGPTFSASFLEPFRRVFATLPPDQRPTFEPPRMKDGARLSAAHALARLDFCVRYTGLSNLGIAAGLQVSPGNFGAIDYAMHAAPTLRGAVAVADRYRSLVSDTWSPRIERTGAGTVLRLRAGDSAAPRAAGDFTVCGFYTNHLRNQVGPGALREAWFAHPRPRDVEAYESALPNIALRFDAPVYGFLLADDSADAPRPGGNGSIHALLCTHVNLLHAELRQPPSFTHRVREAILAALGEASVLTIHRAGRVLHVSDRTLGRRLQDEGTTFARERDLIRRQLAEEYLVRPNLSLEQVSQLLGFTHIQAFHRSFKRWTGDTPAAFQRRRSARPKPAS